MNIEFSKKFFLTIFLICLALGFKLPEVFAHESGNLNEFVIHMDEDGYVPKSINVEIGTKVIFENIGNSEHWPASDNHPSHTLYNNTNIEDHCEKDSLPTFDSCEEVKAGQSWSFVFDKIGTHVYHDHLWPHLHGTIIVENSNNKNENIEDKKSSRFLIFFEKIFYKISSLFTRNKEYISLNYGSSGTEFYENLKKKYEDIVIESNPREAISSLREDSLQDDRVSALCHDILHGIGHVAFDKYGSFKDAVQYQSDFCNSGYIHGLFESYFKEAESPLSNLSEQCSEYASDKRPFDLWQCYHGIGHGFMYLTGGDLDESLELCEKGLEQEAATSCKNGVFMEVFNLEILSKEKSFIDPTNPFLTCSTRNISKADCYLFVPVYLSQTSKMDFSDIFKECNKAESGYKSICIYGVGSEAIKRNMNNTDEVFSLCRQAGLFTYQEKCVEGVVSMYMNQEGSYSSGERLCKSVPSIFKDTCDTMVSSRKSFFK